MMIQGTVDGISLYIGFQSDAPGTAEKALIQTLTGNFPGMVMESLNATKIDEIMGRMSSNPNHELKTVGAVSVVPSSREERFSGADVQGMEKFMDTMQGKEFTALIIATPYSKDVIDRRILSLEAISTALSPLEQISVHDTQSQSTALTDTTAQTLSQTISNSISEAYSVTNSNGVFSSSEWNAGGEIGWHQLWTAERECNRKSRYDEYSASEIHGIFENDCPDRDKQGDSGFESQTGQTDQPASGK